MPNEKDLTFKQLAQIALGGPSLGNLNISLLHTIINLTLKKLDCEYEKVTLSGVPAENLQELLQKSKSGPSLIFDDEKVKIPMKNLEKLGTLEEKVTMLECNLDHHLKDINFPIIKELSHITVPCQTACEVEEQKSETLSKLLKNEEFLRGLKSTLSIGLSCHLNRLEIDLTRLMHQMDKFKEQCQNAYESMNVVENLLVVLLDLRSFIHEYRTDFEATMEEIQKSLDMKVDNCEIRKVKSDFRDMIEKATGAVTEYVNMRKKPRALSGYFAISVPDENDLKRNMTLKHTQKKSQKSVCQCDELPTENFSSLLERIKNIDLNDVLWRRMQMDIHSFRLP